MVYERSSDEKATVPLTREVPAAATDSDGPRTNGSPPSELAIGPRSDEGIEGGSDRGAVSSGRCDQTDVHQPADETKLSGSMGAQSQRPSTDPALRRAAETVGWLRPVDAWPGLFRLWTLGQQRGLLIAVTFACLIQLLVICSWIWPAVLPAGAKWAIFAVLLTAWTCGARDARKQRTILAANRGTDPQVDLFLAARREYLRGDWSSAETTLSRMIARHPEDVSARLLLATLYRRQGRHRETRDQLRRLQRWQASAHWFMEIRREWEMLAKAEMAGSRGNAEQSDGEQSDGEQSDGEQSNGGLVRRSVPHAIRNLAGSAKAA